MWFNNMENWSTKKLKITFMIYGLIYLIFAMVIPCVIVGCKYNLIKSSSIRLTGVGLILVICVAVFMLKGVKRLLLKLPQEEHKEQCFKFTVLMIYELILPAGALVLIYLIKQNVMLACDTLTKCTSSFICATMIDYMAIKYLEVELDLRREAKHQIAVNKRIETLTK